MILFNFEDYDNFSAGTDKHTGNYRERIEQHAMGLAAETGEVLSKIYKRGRDGLGDVNEFDWEYGVVRELGDVLWFITRLAADMNYTLKDVALINKSKLQSRIDRDAIHGSGDNR